MLAKPEDHGDKLIFAWFSNPFVIEKNEELVFKIIIITSLDIDHGNCWTWIHKYIHIFQMHNTQEKSSDCLGLIIFRFSRISLSTFPECPKEILKIEECMSYVLICIAYLLLYIQQWIVVCRSFTLRKELWD